MTAPIYAYRNRGGDAARHIIANTTLAESTQAEDYYWAGADCTRLTPPPWRLSTGEQELWSAAETFANEDGLLDMVGAGRVLDARSLAVLLEAVAIYFGLAAEVAAS